MCIVVMVDCHTAVVRSLGFSVERCCFGGCEDVCGVSGLHNGGCGWLYSVWSCD